MKRACNDAVFVAVSRFRNELNDRSQLMIANLLFYRCYRPEGIRLKLTSAQKDDKPRWGDYKEKLDLDYIAGLIRTGHWFDGSKPFFLVKAQRSGDERYAPAFVWRNRQRFDYLLNPPSATTDWMISNQTLLPCFQFNLSVQLCFTRPHTCDDWPLVGLVERRFLLHCLYNIIFELILNKILFFLSLVLDQQASVSVFGIG